MPKLTISIQKAWELEFLHFMGSKFLPNEQLNFGEF